MVSVILPARDAASTISSQLAALQGQTYKDPWEIIVVDNGSGDQTAVIVSDWSDRLPHLRLLEAPDIASVNHARNVGCKASAGEIILICDADDIVDGHWVEAMTACLRQHDTAGGTVERALLNDAVAIAARPPKPTNGLWQTFGFLPYPIGANCGLRKEVWRRLGGFDESFISGCADTEFFWRAQLAGFDIDFAVDAVVHYRLRSTNTGIMRQYYGYGQSHVLLYRKFAAVGMPRSTAGDVLTAWWRLVAALPGLCTSRTRRAVWLGKLALRCGRAVGSIRSRTLYL